jgi:hypothetical protein
MAAISSATPFKQVVGHESRLDAHLPWACSIDRLTNFVWSITVLSQVKP